MKQRKSTNGEAGDNAHSVPLSQLDLKLSEWVSKARNAHPVMVKRYDVPWVWIVAHPLWTEMDRLLSFIPPKHTLLDLREAIDDAMAYDHDVMRELDAQCACGASARVVLRAWLLQILYSRGSARQVREILNYNLLWRWFVGYDRISESLPPEESFIRDMETIGTEPGALKIVCPASPALRRSTMIAGRSISITACCTPCRYSTLPCAMRA
ncbi:transposase [Brenneria populi]|uniref:transposase n=1 Tax=Brenneria populi TaxID=1505588 RepID=UPI00399BBA22